MFQFNRLAAILLAILLVYKFETTECSMPYSWVEPAYQLFIKKADFKLSRTYDNVVAVDLQCISAGNQYENTTFYADARFTFKQANETASGNFRYMFGSQSVSIGAWKTNDTKGIQLSSITLQSYWNGVKCDVVNITTNSKSVQHSVFIAENGTAYLECPEIGSVLTIDDNFYGNDKADRCTAYVRDIVAKDCNSANNSRMCIFSVLNKQLGGEPCLNLVKDFIINYSCTQPNCVMGINGTDGSCSKVWTEQLTNRVPTITEKPSPASIPYLTVYEERITELEKDQRLAEFKIQNHDSLLKEYHNLIQESIIPTLALLCTDKDSSDNDSSDNDYSENYYPEKYSSKNKGNCAQRVQHMLERSKKLFQKYKSL